MPPWTGLGAVERNYVGFGVVYPRESDSIMARLIVPEISQDLEPGAVRPRRPFLSPTARKAILSAHIMISVGLLGDSAGFFAVAMRAGTTHDPGGLTELAG